MGYSNKRFSILARAVCNWLTSRRLPPSGDSNADSAGANYGLVEILARPERLELPTYWFEASRSIHLSYGRALEVIICRRTRRAIGSQEFTGTDRAGYVPN